MTFKAGWFFIMLVVGSIAFPLNEEEDMSFFYDNAVDPLIIGGVEAGHVPHMVALTTGFFIKSLLCGSSIINERFVLTAAHCLTGLQTGESMLSSLRGALGSNRWSSSPIEIRFSRAIEHAGYRPDIVKNDIGFLVTVSAIAFTDNVQPIVLNFDFIGGGVATIANGWGARIIGGPMSRILMELHSVTVDGARCISEVARVGEELNRPVLPVHPEVEICAFFKRTTGMCHGDSGSALVLEENKQQIGVVSWGVPCARGAPDMFARVSNYKSWIEQQLQQSV